MAIGIAPDFRRRMRIGVCFLVGILTLCTAAGAQAPPVTAGSVVTVPANNTWGQIYKILFYQGNVLALDATNDGLYQLAPGATAWTTIASKTINNNVLGQGYGAQGMALDAKGNLYITIAYNSSIDSTAYFWRIPYQNGTWTPTASDGWGDNLIDPNSGNAFVGENNGDGTVEVFFQNSPKMDGSGTLYWQETRDGDIYSAPVKNDGNASQSSVLATGIVSGLKSSQGKIAVDVNGNIYFVEYHDVVNTGRDVGIYFIPAGQNGLVGVGAPIVRIDAGQANSTQPTQYAGVTLDANGDLYLISESNASFDEYAAGTWEIPNVCSPTAVNASNVTQCLNYNNISMLAPVDGNEPLAIDSRGYLWIPSYQASFPPNTDNSAYPSLPAWQASTAVVLNYEIVDPSGHAQKVTTAGTTGSSEPTFNDNGATTADGTAVWTDQGKANPGIYALVVWAPGVLNLNHLPAGPSATGSAGPAGILYYSFNSSVTPGGFLFSSSVPGTASAFATTLTNPLPPASSTTAPAAPCNTLTNGQYPSYSSQGWCELWVTLDPTAPGPVSGELTILDSNNNPIPSSTVYVSGTGQGPGVSMLDSPQLTTVAAGLKTPTQVASDALGDTWVADPGNKQVLYFPAGSSAANGTSIGTGLSAPTGVAVDGSGDVYIADSSSGNVFKIPCVVNPSSPGSCAYGTQTTVATGLGTSGLNLAVDGSGDVFVADPQNSRVVKIFNPSQSNLIPNNNALGAATSTIVTVGSGFTAPSAVAVDTFGNVYVADSGNLYEVLAPPFTGQTAIVEGTLGNVTGLAVDPSGSVIVAENGGMIRIPFINGGLNNNSAGPLDNTVDVPGNSTTSVATVPITSPNGVALDQTGNLYVTDMTGGTPNLYQLSVNGFVDFGVGLVPTQLAEQDVPLVNIGNEPLSLTGTANPISFSGGTAEEDGYFSITQPSQGTPCDPTGATQVAPGTSCSLGAGFTPPIPPAGDTGSITYSGVTMSVPTNAANIAGGTVTAGLQGTALAGLEPTQTTVQVNLTSSSLSGERLGGGNCYSGTKFHC